MTSELIELARSHGLVALAQALAQTPHTWTAGPRDLDMRLPLKSSLEVALASMTRRGLRLTDVAEVARTFAPSAVESGLLAWSVLKQRLFDASEQDAARSLWKRAEVTYGLIGDPAACWLQRDPATLVELLEPESAKLVGDSSGTAFDPPFGLARLEAIRRQGGIEALHQGDLLRRVREAAWTLALGRATSLAWAYFSYLWHTAQYPTAMMELCELALDERAFDQLPTEEDWRVQHASFAPLRAYVEGRARLGIGDRAGAEAALASVPAAQGDGSYQLLLSCEIAPDEAATDTQVGRLEAICRTRPLWKHAQRLRTVATMRRDLAGGKEVAAVARIYAAFEGTFGFDARTFAMANLTVPIGHPLRELLEQRLVRNLVEMPYEYWLWFDLGARLQGRERLWAELRHRRSIQGL